VAHHFTQAGETEPAIEWRGNAGDVALRRSAFQEAIAHLGKAIEMADKGGGGAAPTPLSQRLKLQTDYGHAVMWSKGFAATETRAAFNGVDEQTPEAANGDERLKVSLARILRAFAGGYPRAACQIAEGLLRQAEGTQDAAAVVLAMRRRGMARLLCGELLEAKRQLELGLGMRDREPALCRLDAQASASGWLAITSWILGVADQARVPVQQSTAFADQSRHTPTIVNVRFCETILEACRNDPVARCARPRAQ
jgi:hypothetical protein